MHHQTSRDEAWHHRGCWLRHKHQQGALGERAAAAAAAAEPTNQRNSVATAGNGSRASSVHVAGRGWGRGWGEGGRHGHACRHRPRPSGWVGGDSSGACSAGTGGACSVAETGAGGLGACCAALATVCGVAAVAGCSVCRVGARPGVDQVGSGGGAGVEHGAGGPGAGSRQAGQAKTKAAPPRPAGGKPGEASIQRSRKRHRKQKLQNCGTRGSQVIPQPSTNLAQPCLTSEC